MVGLIDQGLQASIKFLALLLFARWLTQEDFGIFALATASSVMLVGVQYAIIVVPFIVSCPTVEQAEDNRAQWYWLHLMMIAAVVGCLIVFLAVLIVVEGAAWLQDTVKFTLVIAPLWLNVQFTYRWLYQVMKFGVIIRMSTAYFVTYALGIGVVILGFPTVWAAVLAFASAPAAAICVAFFAVRPPGFRSARGMFAAWLKTRSLAGWSLLSRFTFQVNYQVMIFIIATVAGMFDVAAFAATRSLIQPSGTLVAAVDMIDKPRAGRAYAKDGIAGLKRSIPRTMRIFLIFGLPYLVLLFVFADEAIALIYGTKYAAYGVELRLWIAVAFLGLVQQPLSVIVVTMRKVRASFLCNALSASVAIGVVVALIGDYGVRGAILATLAGRIVGVALFIAFIMSVWRTQRTESGPTSRA